LKKDDTELLNRQRAIVLDFATINKLITRDLALNKSDTLLLRKYKKSDVITFLEQPSRYAKQLRDISIFLYNKSPQYKRLVNYFSKMAIFAYEVTPYKIDYEKPNLKALSNQFKKLNEFLDTMNIRHEFMKIMSVAFREDAFFGYEHFDKDSYFIQQLNPDYCQISSIEDSCYNFAFDFSYFNGFQEKLETFPSEFKSKYNAFLKDSNLRWQELDSSQTICVKINEDLSYLIPPFAGVFESLFDIEDFKALRKEKTKLQNYKILIQKLPMRKDSDANNDFMIDYQTMEGFHMQAASAVPDQVAVITSPMDFVEISFDKSMADDDNVARAERDYWSGAGVSQLLFNTDKSSSIGLNYSIQTDEAILFAVLRQIERWINRRIKFLGNFNYRLNMLDVTVFNQQDKFDQLIQAFQYGVPVKTKLGAILGMSPTDMVNMSILENDILGLNERFIPPASAHTQSDGATSQGGAPAKKAKDLSASGAKARNNGNSNAK
jgi:hypothetical protein